MNTKQQTRCKPFQKRAHPRHQLHFLVFGVVERLFVEKKGGRISIAGKPEIVDKIISICRAQNTSLLTLPCHGMVHYKTYILKGTLTFDETVPKWFTMTFSKRSHSLALPERPCIIATKCCGGGWSTCASPSGASHPSEAIRSPLRVIYAQMYQ